MSWNIEKGLISKILETKDLNPLKEKQIKPSYFSGDNRTAYQFIRDKVMEIGEVPSVRVFEKRFPNYVLDTIEQADGSEKVGTEESIEFWCTELRNKVKHNTLADVVDEAAKSLSDLDTETALSLLKQKIAFIDSEVEYTEEEDLTNVEGRKEAYLKKKRTQGMMGIETGFKHLDYMLKGLAPATLTTLIAGTGVGKRIADNTPVLTPNGFACAKDLKVGDTLFDEKGAPTKILGIYPEKQCDTFRVHFEDNTYVDCDKGHLWKFKTSDDLTRNNDWQVDTLENMMKLPIKRGRAFNLSIPICAPIQFEKREYPIDPYALGAFLGDSSLLQVAQLTNPEEDVVLKVTDKILKDFPMLHTQKDHIRTVFAYELGKSNPLITTFRHLGLFGKHSFNKFIPSEYLLGSVEQRLELLKGLIDTDGSVNSKGAASFYTTSPRLCEDVMRLVQSLGIRCRKSVYRDGEYVIRLQEKTDVVFSSKKHRARFEARKKVIRKPRYDVMKITDIELLTDKKDMRCFAVDSPYHTFICGDYIVTHNTWFEVIIGANCALNDYKVLHLVTEMSNDIMRDRYEAVLFAKCYGEFNYNSFKSGTLTLKQERKYFEFLENDLSKFESFVLANASGVLSVSSLIEKHKPDIVMIDGAYLMEDDQGAKDDWLRVAHITRDLKKLSKRMNVPILINTQADKNTSKKTGPELGSIMYTQAIGQDSDIVLALYRDQAMISDREMGVKVLKQREGTLGKVTLNWNFDIMDFSEIYMEKDSSESDDSTESNFDVEDEE